MLILKQNTSANVASPSAGKTTLFFNENGALIGKQSNGTVQSYVDNVSPQFSGNANITGNLGVSGTIFGNVSGNISGNIVVPGANTQLLINDNGNIGASANLTFTGTNLGVTGNLAVSGNALITGNLTVNGNVVYVNVETLDVEAPIIELGGGPNGALLTGNDGFDRGEVLHYYTTQAVDAFMGWDNSNSEFAFGSNVSVASDVVTFNTLGNIRASTFKGNVDAATINSSGNANVGNLGTGGLVVATGNVSGGNLTTAGAVSATGNVSGGNLVTTGTANIGNLVISGAVQGNFIPSTSNTYSLGNGTNYWKDLFLSEIGRAHV